VVIKRKINEHKFWLNIVPIVIIIVTVDEQIDFIIDQSTDVNIRDRSWDVLETFM